jgi:creatinine amidohydrolase
MVDLVRHGVQPLSPNGVLGDPAGATADAGARIFERLADHLAAAVDDWATA